MINQDKLTRIKSMEERLNLLQHTLDNTDRALLELESQIKEYQKLKDYYTSQNWHDDKTLSNTSDFPSPKELPHGVLSEDAVFNEIGHYREVGLRLLKLGTQMLEDY